MKKTYAGLFILLAILVIAVVAIKTLEPQEVNYENYVDNTESPKGAAQIEDLSKTDTVEQEVNYDYLFTSPTSTTNEYSNVIGTLANESFAWYVPDWLVENWDMKTYEGKGQSVVFTPKGNVDAKLISGISFYFEPSTESFNAATMYENENNGKILIREILLSQHKEGRLQILIEPETRIYHVQSESINMISDAYILDGNGYTLRIHFMADKALFQRYANEIRNMVDGIGEVRGPRG